MTTLKTRLVAGDTNLLTLTIRWESNGVLVDLTGCTVSVRLVNIETGAVTTRAGTVTGTGTVTVGPATAWAFGAYEGEVQITFGSGVIRTWPDEAGEWQIFVRNEIA